MNSRKAMDAPDFLVPKDQQTELEMAEWSAEMAIRDRDVLRKAIQRAAPSDISDFFHPTPAERSKPIVAPIPPGTRQKAILDVLADGLWHPGHELTGPKCGGSEGLRRLRELRAKGYRIEARKIQGRSSWQYKLIK